MSNFVTIAQLEDLVDGQPYPAKLDAIELVIIRRGDEVIVLEGRCPHQGTLLAEGALEEDALVCRAHGWRFDCQSGERLGHPDVCLQRFPARVEAGSVLVEREAVLASKRGSTKSTMTSIKQLPGPKGLPLLGNLRQLDLSRLHLITEEWCAQYGPLYKFRLGTKPILVVAEPSMIASILRDRPDNYRRLRAIETVFKELGVNGVFSAEGEAWRHQRRLVMDALDAKHLRQFFPTLVEVTRRLKRRWEKAAASGEPVDVPKDLMRYTVDVTVSLVFGYDMNTLEQEGDVIQQHLEKIMPMINRRVNALFPYWRYWKLRADRELDKALLELRKASDEFVAQARERLAKNPALVQEPSNLLESMLLAHDDADHHFSDDELFGNILTMLVAGEDTTANTMAWMIDFMTEFPEVQARMRAEADAVLKQADVLADMKAIEQFNYLDAVANETMRLKPVAPIIFVESNVDVEVGGIHVPRGTGIMLLTRVACLHDNHFTEAEAFRPERWLTGQTPPAHNRNAFMPFGAGPRFCPGRNLALLEIKIVMAMIARHFELTKVPDGKPTAETYAFTMNPQSLAILLRTRRTAEDT